VPTSELEPPEEASTCDPLPREVRAAAKAAYSCRWGQADVAPLVFDSWLEGGSRRGPRYVVFRGDDLTVELAVAPDRSVVGRILPPSTTDMVLRWPGGSRSSRSDEFGCFTLPNLPPGPASLRFPARPGRWSRPVGTEWIVF
jgi:hypothetical protein